MAVAGRQLSLAVAEAVAVAINNYSKRPPLLPVATATALSAYLSTNAAISVCFTVHQGFPNSQIVHPTRLQVHRHFIMKHDRYVSSANRWAQDDMVREAPFEEVVRRIMRSPTECKWPRGRIPMLDY